MNTATQQEQCDSCKEPVIAGNVVTKRYRTLYRGQNQIRLCDCCYFGYKRRYTLAGWAEN